MPPQEAVNRYVAVALDEVHILRREQPMRFGRLRGCYLLRSAELLRRASDTKLNVLGHVRPPTNKGESLKELTGRLRLKTMADRS